MATGDEVPDVDTNQTEMAQEGLATEHEPVKAKKNIVKSKWQRVKASRRFKILTLAGITLAGFALWRGPYAHYNGLGKGTKKPAASAKRPLARSSAQKPSTTPGRAGQTLGSRPVPGAAGIRKAAGMAEELAADALQDLAEAYPGANDDVAQLRGSAAYFLRGREVNIDRSAVRVQTNSRGPSGRPVEIVEQVGDFVAPRPAAPPAEAPRTDEETLADRVLAGASAEQAFKDRCARRRACEAYDALPWYQRIFAARP